jgi:hypothetical protein
MESNTKKYIRYFNNNLKLDLSCNGLLNQSEVYNILEEIKNKDKKEKIKIIDPAQKSIENYANIDCLLNNKGINTFEYLYLNKTRIHQILYNEDENITITSGMMKKYSDYYYLYFLIRDEEVLNYKYEFGLISELKEKINIIKSPIKKIIFSKILLCLLKNFKENEEDEYGDKCEEMEQDCKDWINSEKKSLENYNNLNLDNLEGDDVEIDDIYINILISLIKNNKLNDSEETRKILAELEIKDLRLNKKIFNGLKSILNENNLKKYLIIEYNDFLSNEIITFYRILFVYIFKSSDYIFQIPFFIELREQIIELVKTKIDILYNDLKKGKNQDIIIKLNEVLSYFTNPDIYIEKYKKEQKEKNSQQSLNNPSIQGSGFSNKPSNNSNFGSSDSNANQGSSSLKNPFDNSSVKNRDPTDPFGLSIIDNEQDEKEKEQAYQILKKSKFSLDINYEKGQREANINYSSITYGEDKDSAQRSLEINDIKSIKAEDEILMTNYEKFNQFLNQIEKDIKTRYKKEKKINLIIEFTMTSESLEHSENYRIDCKYIIKDKTEGENDFVDEDFLNNANYEGLSCMIETLCS